MIVVIILNIVVLIYILGVIPKQNKELKERIEVIIKNQKTLLDNIKKDKE